jgi:O-antigen/teichoic acid export membrane protein
MALALLLAVPATILGYILLPLFLGIDRADSLFLSRIYLMCFLPLNFLTLAQMSLELAEQRFLPYNLLRLIPGAIYFAGLIVIFLLDAVTVERVLWASWLGLPLMAAVCAWWWRSRILMSPATDEGLSLLRQGVRFHAATLVVLFGAQIDRIVVMNFFSNHDIGNYIVAQTIAFAGLGLVTHSVQVVLFPLMTAEENRGRATTIFVDALRRSVVFLVFGSAGAVVLIPYLIPMAFGKNFSGAIVIAIALVFAFVPLGLRQIIVQCLRAFGDSTVGPIVEMTAVVVFLLLVVPGVMFFGLIAVPISLSVGNVVSLLTASYFLKRKYQISSASWLWPNKTMVADFMLVLHLARRSRQYFLSK